MDLAVVLFSAMASAGAGHSHEASVMNLFSGESYSRGYSCSAYDAGWEEHWGGHGSCSSCLSKHGRCIEKCTEEVYTCTVEGTDRFGHTQTYSASHESRWRAEDRAMDRCQWNSNSCYVKSCDSQSEVVSRRSC